MVCGNGAIPSIYPGSAYYLYNSDVMEQQASIKSPSAYINSMENREFNFLSPEQIGDLCNGMIEVDETCVDKDLSWGLSANLKFTHLQYSKWYRKSCKPSLMNIKSPRGY